MKRMEKPESAASIARRHKVSRNLTVQFMNHWTKFLSGLSSVQERFGNVQQYTYIIYFIYTYI
jgi:hypothetical protein